MLLQDISDHPTVCSTRQRYMPNDAGLILVPALEILWCQTILTTQRSIINEPRPLIGAHVTPSYAFYLAVITVWSKQSDCSGLCFIQLWFDLSLGTWYFDAVIWIAALCCFRWNTLRLKALIWGWLRCPVIVATLVAIANNWCGLQMLLLQLLACHSLRAWSICLFVFLWLQCSEIKTYTL